MKKPLLAQLGFLVLTVFFSLLSRTLFSPLLPTMVRDLGITHSRAGSFFFYIASGYAISMLLSGFLSQRITHRWTIGLSVFIAAIGLMIVAAASTADFMPVGFLIIGAGTGLYPPSGITTMTHLVEPARWGTATAVHELGPNAAFIAAPFVASVGIAVADWRAALWCTAVFCIIAGTLFLRWGRGGDFAGVPPHLSKISVLLKSRTFLVVVLFYVVTMSAFLGVYTMLPSYLVDERGMPGRTVNTLIGLSRVSGLFTIFIAGILVDRIHAGKLIATMVLLVSASTIGIGVFRGGLLVASIMVEATVGAAFVPIMLTVLSRASPAALRSLSIAVTIPFAYVVGGGLVPYLLGLMAVHATFSWGFIILGVLMAGSLAATPAIPGGHD